MDSLSLSPPSDMIPGQSLVVVIRPNPNYRGCFET